MKQLNNKMMVYRVSEDLYYKIKKYQDASNVEISPLIRNYIESIVLEELVNKDIEV